MRTTLPTPPGYKRAKIEKISPALCYATCPDCGKRHESALLAAWLPGFITCDCNPETPKQP